MIRGRLRTDALLAAALLAAACGSTPPRWVPAWPPSAAASADDFARARDAMERGEDETAWRILARLAEAHPDALELAVWLQEVELVLLERGAVPDPLASLAEDASPEEALRRQYRARAEAEPTAANLILAARVEDDAFAALNLLDRARDLEPTSAWAHYGRAHALLRIRGRADRWRDGRAAVDEALRLDPGHLRARRLEAWMLAQEGSTAEAAAALATWLDVTAGDPRVAAEERVQAEVDLALLLVLDGEPERAREILGALEGRAVARDRRLMVLAAAEQALGELDEALDAAQRAEGAARSEVLPLVQQAFLQEYWLEDREAADALWAEVIELAREDFELATYLESFRAQVVLERSGAAAAASDGGEGSAR